MTMKDTRTELQLYLSNTEKLFSKRGHFHFLTEQGKTEKGEKLPAKKPLVVESPLALRDFCRKNLSFH